MIGLTVPKWLKADRFFFAFSDLPRLAVFFGRLVRCKKKRGQLRCTLEFFVISLNQPTLARRCPIFLTNVTRFGEE